MNLDTSRRSGRGWDTSKPPLPMSSRDLRKQQHFLSDVGGDWCFGQLPPEDTMSNPQSSIKADSNGSRYNATRYQHGGHNDSPISLASTTTDPREHLSLHQMSYKRSGSPFILLNGSNKRHQGHQSPQGYQSRESYQVQHLSNQSSPSRPPRPDQSRLSYDGGEHLLDLPYSRQQLYQNAPIVGVSRSPMVEQNSAIIRSMRDSNIRQGASPRFHGPPNGHVYCDPQTPDTLEKALMRTISQHPPPQYYTPQDHRPRQHPVSGIPHSNTNDRRDIPSYSEHPQKFHRYKDERGRYWRSQTTAPENRRKYHEYQENVEVSKYALEPLAIKKPRLGSPWGNERRHFEHGNDHLEMETFESRNHKVSPQIQIEGRIAVQPRGREEIRRRGMIFAPSPRTPINLQDRGRSKSRPPSSSRMRSSSFAPISHSHYSTSPVRDRYDEQDHSEEDSPPMNELLRKQRRAGHISHRNRAETGFTAADILSQGSIFHTSRSKSRPSAQPLGTPQSSTNGPDVINLISPDGPAHSPPRQTVKPISMKDLLPPGPKPASKPATKKESSMTSQAKVKAKAEAAKMAKKESQKERQKTQEPPENPDAVRQKLAARQIIERELKAAEAAKDKELFGGMVDEDPEAKEKRLEGKRIESQRKRQEKLAHILAKEEASKLEALEKQALEAAEAETKRLEKEKEEQRKKEIRDQERKRKQAAEIAEQNEKRKLAAEKIIHDREEAEKSALEKAATAKLDGVQAEPKAVVKLKEKQEDAKKLAASLKSVKIPSARVAKKAASKDNSSISEEPEEDSLFVPEITEAERMRAKSMGLLSAAKVFAKAGTTANDSKYRLEMDIAEREREVQLAVEAKARLDARWKDREQSPGPEKPAVPQAQPHSKPAKTAPANTNSPKPTLPKPQEKQIIEEELEVDDLFGDKLNGTDIAQPQSDDSSPDTAVDDRLNATDIPLPQTGSSSAKTSFDDQADNADTSQPQIGKPSANTSLDDPPENADISQPQSGKTSANTSFNISFNTSYTAKSASLDHFTQATRNIFNHKVKLISDLEREELDKEAKEKRAKGSSSRQSATTEEQKAKAKEYRDTKARERQRKRLLDEAAKNGVQLTEIALNTQLEAYMEKREERMRKTAETRSRKENIQSFAPDALPLHSRIEPQQREPSPEPREPSVEENLTEELRIRKENEKAMREGLAAFARERGGAFSNAASKKTVADFENDSESEEDPLPEPVPVAQASSNASENGDSDEYDEDSERSGEEIEVAPVQKPNPDEHDVQIVTPPPDMSDAILSTPRQALYKSPYRTKGDISAMGRALKENQQLGAQVVWIYTVYETLTFNGFPEDYKQNKEVVKKEVGRFATIKEANDSARKRMQKPRERQVRVIQETTDDLGLLTIEVAYDKECENMLAVWVEMIERNIKDVSDIDLNNLEQRLPTKLYSIWSYAQIEELDEETGTMQVYHQKPERHGVFSSWRMANNEACEKLCKLIQPKGAKMNDWATWHDFKAKLEYDRDSKNLAQTAEEQLFSAEIVGDEVMVTWLDFARVAFCVEVQEIKGPLN